MKTTQKKKKGSGSQESKLTELQRQFASLESPSWRGKMYQKENWSLYDGIISKIPDQDIKTLMEYPGYDPGITHHNLTIRFRWSKGEEVNDYFTRIADAYSALAKAIRDNQPQCLGRLTTTWLEDHQEGGVGSLHEWQKKYLGDIEKRPEYRMELKEIGEVWPSNLTFFLNTSIPIGLVELAGAQSGFGLAGC
jgi:hypothetical protein